MNVDKLIIMNGKTLRSFSVSVSVAVNHFTWSDGITQTWIKKY